MDNIILLIITFITIWYFFYYGNRETKINRKIVGPIGLPLIGNLLSMNGELHLKFEKWYKKYGPVYRLKMGTVEAVILTEYPILKEAFIDKSESFVKRYQFKSRYRLNNCQDISQENDENHAILKKVVLSEITSTRIKKMEDQISLEIIKLVNLLDKHAEDGKPFNINHYFHMFSLNITLRIIFGIDYPYSKVDEAEGLIKSIIEVAGAAGIPVLSDYLPVPLSENIPLFIKHDEIKKEIEELIKNYQFSEGNQSILSKLMNEFNKGSITMEAVIGTMINLVVGGSDTSANTLIFSIIEIINNCEIQSKLYHSLKSSIHNENEISVSHSKYGRLLPYLSMVIKESYRMFSVVPLGVPHKTTDDVTVNGHLIATGTLIFQNIWASHRSEKFFTSPNEFIPERYSDENNQTTLCHFGVGIRDCVGKSLADAEIFTCLGSLINRYEFINPNPTKPLNNIGKFGLTYQPPTTNVIIKKRI